VTCSVDVAAGGRSFAGLGHHRLGPGGDIDVGSARAACRNAPAGLFYPKASRESPPQAQARETEAERVCATCPVQTECLSYAVRLQENFGIWGGLTERERHRLAGKRDAEPRPRDPLRCVGPRGSTSTEHHKHEVCPARGLVIDTRGASR